MSLTVNEIRSKFLQYMEEKGHAIVPSSSLVPENDPTTLFTGSGMQPMVPYLLGQPHPLGTRIADSQKAFRSQDIEEVGDNRHTTFFEMLGNWSFGDYFKEEQITWMWNFLIDELKLNPKNFYVTCFAGNDALGVPRDTLSAELWQKLFLEKGIAVQTNDTPEEGMKEGERIFYYGEKKNWWSRSGVPANMPEGEPGGPDSEMFYDFDSDLSKKVHELSVWKDEPCHVNCDCGRFLEIGNNVFMQYKKTAHGFEELPQMNVDHGSGLERYAAALRNDPDIFNIDVFDKAKEIIEKLSGFKYEPELQGAKERNGKIISVGGLSFSELQDGRHLTPQRLTYAYRVILDHLRAATFLISDGVFPGNKEQMYFVRRLIRRAVRYARDLGVNENFTKEVGASFIETYKIEYKSLEEKMVMILNELDKEETKFRKTLERGLVLIKNYLANGISLGGNIDPLNLEHETARRNVINGRELFNLYSTHGFPVELSLEILEELRNQNIHSEFLKFNREEVLKEFKLEQEKHKELSQAGAEQKFKGGLADTSDMSVKYHTATHLLHEALRQVLGDHVLQKGSNITPERLRFDFSHGEKMIDEQKAKVERIINDVIAQDLPVIREEVSYEEARARGAIGVFDAKYGDTVSIYTIGESGKRGEAKLFSMEFCGGPHVERTGVLGHFKIQKEEAVSQGVRRIKAILS